MTFPQRGGHARDKRTGAYVYVAEAGADGASWLVRTVYKSDGYWAASADLEPSADPHAWTIRHLWRLVVVFLAAVWAGCAASFQMQKAGMGGGGVIVYGIVISYGVGMALSRLSGLNRP